MKDYMMLPCLAYCMPSESANVVLNEARWIRHVQKLLKEKVTHVSLLVVAVMYGVDEVDEHSPQTHGGWWACFA